MSRFLVKAFLWIFLGSIVGLTACVPYKNLVYLNEGAVVLDENAPAQVKTIYTIPNRENYRIQSADILQIQINSLQENSVDYLQGGQQMQMMQMMAGGGLGTPMYFQGYIVNDSGMVRLPIIGEQQVAGKTLSEIEALLEKQLLGYFKFIAVKVRLANYRITVIGEVARPGVHYVFENYATVPQILGLVGTFPLSNLRKVRLLRETPNGRITVYLDLTNPKVISSDYFYLQPNDMLVVEPLKRKAFDLNIALLGTGASILSLALLIVNLVRN